MKNRVVVIGSYNADLTIKTERIPSPGETIIGGTLSRGSGGKGANQAVAAARAGADVSFIGKVGNDALGKEGIRKLNDEGINTKFTFYDSNEPTGVAFIIVDKNGENCIVVASGANAFLNANDIESASAEISDARVTLVQCESPISAIHTAIKKSRENGAIVILNPAPAQFLELNLLKDIDIMTPNKLEAEMLTGIKVTDEESLRFMVKKFYTYGVENVLITLGSKGVFVGLPNLMKLIPAFKVSSVDTTGAGDVFSGALAAFVAEGMSIEEAANMATASASISITRIGAQNSIPYREEINSFIADYQFSDLRSEN